MSFAIGVSRSDRKPIESRDAEGVQWRHTETAYLPPGQHSLWVHWPSLTIAVCDINFQGFIAQ